MIGVAAQDGDGTIDLLCGENADDLVRPGQPAEGNAVTGVAAEAFREKGITSVKCPYAGGFTIGESAFRGNDINELIRKKKREIRLQKDTKQI